MSEAYDRAHDFLYQVEIDEEMTHAHQDHIMTLEEEMKQHFDECVELGYYSNTEAEEYYRAWFIGHHLLEYDVPKEDLDRSPVNFFEWDQP